MALRAHQMVVTPQVLLGLANDLRFERLDLPIVGARSDLTIYPIVGNA